MVKVKYFKSKKKTNRFNKNQSVWVVLDCANHLWIRFKYRGKGRYVNGVIDKWHHTGQRISDTIGEDGIKVIEVKEDFAIRQGLQLV